MDIYKKNIEALGKHHEQLVELMETTVVDEEKVKVLMADSGVPRVLYRKEDGEEVYIHNAEDPADCANQAIDLLGNMEKEGIIVLFGFGLGYLCEELLERIEKGHILMVYEATLELFKTALKTRDISALLESEKVKIVLGPDADNFSIIHNHHQLIANGKFWVVKHHPSMKLNEKAYDNFLKRLNEEKRLSEAGVSTVVNLGKEFINTFLSNIPSIIRKPGVNKLKDVFKGRPAIVVSAGPSLDRNFHLLRKAKGKATIIAVDVVLPTLLAADIIPDVLVAIDPMPENIAVFRDNPILKQVPFICLAQYTPEIVDIYPGPVFINLVSGNVIFQWLSGLWQDKGYITCIGGSVAHLAFGAAEYMGSEIIAFIGQDLSYEKKFHSGDTTELLHAFHDQEVPDYTKGAIVEEDIFGEKKYTLGTFLVFKTSFENMIKTFKGTVINATEGGLPIKGATSMRLADFIDEYCSDLSELDTFSTLSELFDDEVGYDLIGLITEITAARDKFKEIKKNSARVLKYIKRLRALKDNGQKDSIEFHKILNKVESIIEKVKHPLLNLMVGYHYGLELYLKRQDMQNIDDIEDKWEKLDKQLDRGSHYYNEVINAIVPFNKQLDSLITALQREKLVNSILSDMSIQPDERCIRVGMIYKKAKMTAQAVKYFKAAVTIHQSEISNEEEKDRTQEALLLLAEMYIKQFRFYEAKEILMDGNGQEASAKDEKKITALLKTCNKKIKEWEARKQRMGKLFEKAESNYGSHLESGYFYFRIKDYKRAEKAYLKAIEEEQGARGSKDLSVSYYGLAHTYLAIEDPDKAVEMLENAIGIDPDNPIFYRDLGYIAISSSNVASAELFFKKALELAPDSADLYKTLADIYIGHGEREKAVALYEEALEVNSNNPVFQKELALLYNEVITKT